LKKICRMSTRDVVDRIVKFCEALAHIKFYSYQSVFAHRIVESVILNDGANITGLWSRQVGKSESVAAICAGTASLLPVLASEFPDDDRFKPFYRGFAVGIFAPVEDQALTPYRRMRKMLEDDSYYHDPNKAEKAPWGKAILEELNIALTASRGDRLEMSHGSLITSRTASPQSQTEGGTYNLIVLEESQKLLQSKVEKELSPMLSSTFGTMVHIGTAWESRGGFHNQIQHNEEVYERTGVRNHFLFDFESICAEKRRAYEKDGNPWHLKYEKYIESELAKMGGSETLEFKMNFRCLWHESRTGAVNKAIFSSLADEHLEAYPRREGFQVAGLDIGKINDCTVLTTMTVDLENPIINKHSLAGANEEKQVYHHKTITDILELGGSFEGEVGQYNRLIEHLRMANVRILVIDSTAIGDPVYERLHDMIGDEIMCISFKFTSMSKSMLYKYYLQELHARRITYAAGPLTQKMVEFSKFRSEHLNLDKEISGGYTVCRAAEGEHDDYPDSAALACWAERQMSSLSMPTIEVSSAPFFQRTGGRASGRGHQDSERIQGGMPEVQSSGGSAHRYARRWG
jgi:hypothetical protein